MQLFGFLNSDVNERFCPTGYKTGRLMSVKMLWNFENWNRKISRDELLVSVVNIHKVLDVQLPVCFGVLSNGPLEGHGGGALHKNYPVHVWHLVVQISVQHVKGIGLLLQKESLRLQVVLENIPTKI